MWQIKSTKKMTTCVNWTINPQMKWHTHLRIEYGPQLKYVTFVEPVVWMLPFPSVHQSVASCLLFQPLVQNMTPSHCPTCALMLYSENEQSITALGIEKISLQWK